MQGRTFGAEGSTAAKAEKEKGNDFLQLNELEQAIECYKKALELSPDFTDAHFNLGKAYKLNKNFTEAIKELEITKKDKPGDTEVLVLLGEAYRSNGQYQSAIKNFEEALKADISSDYARRNLEETKNLHSSIFNPSQAAKQRQEQAQKNLNDAISMVKTHLPAGYMKDLADVCVVFDNTNQMSGHSNIAQYEHAKRRIAVTNDYIYANPKIVASYLRHEFLHAKDNDPYTSITEEQEAFLEQAKFWKEQSKNENPPVKDPEMDYVMELYNKSPEALKKRVAEIYQQRDPDIAMTSPHHPETSAAAAGLQNAAGASQPLKACDIIA